MACGRAPFAAAATIGGKETPVGPEVLGPSLERERNLVLGVPGQAVFGDQPPVEVVRDRRGGSDGAHLPLVLDGAQVLHQPARRHELDSISRQLGELRVGAHGHVGLVEPQAHRALAVLAGVERDLERRLEHVLATAHPIEVRDLLLRALDVPEVGQEHAAARPDQEAPFVPVKPVR